MVYREIQTQQQLEKLLMSSAEIKTIAFQNLDFSKVESIALQKNYIDCLFLGCVIPISLNQKLVNDCLIFPRIRVPFNPFVNSLYNRNTLLGHYQIGRPESYDETLDMIVYKHYIENGIESRDIKETLARRLHDYSITDALYDFLDDYDERKIVAVMGGHNLLRNDPDFLKVAIVSKILTESGYLMISGGGPGAMEATHIGAWLANREHDDLLTVIQILSEAPGYQDKLWLDKAFEALSVYPKSDYRSLGIPTWLYGHEPPTPFATDIAKYFANSVREDGLLAIAKGGIIFAPGSAGTVQEIFQDANQNHYLTYNYASPMVFFNSDFWTNEIPVYPLLKQMIDQGKYKNLLLSVCDDEKSVVAEIKKFNEV